MAPRTPTKRPAHESEVSESPVNAEGANAADKRAEADRRFEVARKRFLASDLHRKLLAELAKR